MSGQMTIHDWIAKGTLPMKAHPRSEIDTSCFERFMNPPEPVCYSCKHALKRGLFRICGIGGKGYKKIGRYVDCDKHEEIADEDA